MIDSFETDGDDSSDEESVTQAAGHFEIFDSMATFKAREVDGYALKKADPGAYSFYAYAKGLQILYSPEVNRVYYDKKRQLLQITNDIDSDVFVNWLYAAVGSALSDCFEAHSCPETLLELVAISAEFDTNDCIQTLATARRLLLCQSQSAELLPAMSDLLTPISDVIRLAVESLTKNDSCQPVERFTLSELSTDAKWQAYIDAKVRGYLREKEITKENGALLAQRSRKAKVRVVVPGSVFEQTIIARFADIACRDFQASLIQCRPELAKIHLETVLTAADQVVQRKDEQYEFVRAFDWLSHPELQNLEAETARKYIPSDPERVRVALLERFDSDFKGRFAHHFYVKRKDVAFDWERTELPTQYTFTSKCLVEYLANLRLSYRDQKRHQRQRLDDGGYLKGVTFQRAWQFGEMHEAALEDQEVTKRITKRDKVLDLSNYQGIYTELRSRRQALNENISPKEISDSDIARWVLHIIQHKPVDTLFTDKMGAPILLKRVDAKQMRQFLTSLSYLIFGCEVLRNPAGLVTQLIMLEQIRDNKLTWQGALAKQVATNKGTVHKSKRSIPYGGGRMPMSMGSYEHQADGEEKTVTKRSEPVPCARTLQAQYGLFAVRRYQYMGEAATAAKSSEVCELVRREKQLVKCAIESAGAADENAQLHELDEHINRFFMG